MSNRNASRQRIVRFARPILLAFAVCIVAAGLGCANGEIRLGDPFDRKLTLEEAQHRYTVLVRWSQFQKSKDFVAEANRADYLAQMKSFDDARFTDYESDSVELDQEKQTATIRVVYTMYFPATPYETEVAEVQEWSRDGMSNGWTVVSKFESLPSVAAN